MVFPVIELLPLTVSANVYDEYPDNVGVYVLVPDGSVHESAIL